jgi:hypothetical protein
MNEQEAEYLTTEQLLNRIPYAESTIRAFMTKGVLQRDVHYVKAPGRRRLFFKWSAMQEWLTGQQSAA